VEIQFSSKDVRSMEPEERTKIRGGREKERRAEEGSEAAKA
jgi:hypothetical protein